jgi:molybdate/tungstate transport system ATP-binding protein
LALFSRIKTRKTEARIISDKVEKAASDMNITHLLGRNTQNLSGGELQRVALARTLITSPRLLLLDEPLSSLDASLKDDMKRLLRSLNKNGQTIIHVTHDYSDAISLAKLVGVIHNGRIIQEGLVEDVFKNPVNRFVARYAGIRNFFKVEITGENGFLTGVTKNNVRFKFTGVKPCNDCLLIVKSDSIAITKEKPEDELLNSIKGKIIEIIPSEYGMEITVETGELFFVKVTPSVFECQRLKMNDDVWLNFKSEAVVVLNGTN